LFSFASKEQRRKRKDKLADIDNVTQCRSPKKFNKRVIIWRTYIVNEVQEYVWTLNNNNNDNDNDDNDNEKWNEWIDLKWIGDDKREEEENWSKCRVGGGSLKKKHLFGSNTKITWPPK
ncbi:helicase, partial [Reticulomyxa filosa]